MEKYPTLLEGSPVYWLAYSGCLGGGRIGTLVSGQIGKELDGWWVQEQGFVYTEGQRMVSVRSYNSVTICYFIGDGNHIQLVP